VRFGRAKSASVRAEFAQDLGTAVLGYPRIPFAVGQFSPKLGDMPEKAPAFFSANADFFSG
jgi:hypothetical protein